MALQLQDVNLADADRFVQGPPHDVWRLLRREAPIHWNDGTDRFPGFWSITKYEDIVAISRNPTTFISSKGIAMMTNPNETGGVSAQGKMMLMTDPPRHVRLRRLVNKGFTPRMVAKLEPAIREVTTDIIDDVAERGSCDFVTDIAARLPLAVICDMMGVPREDAPFMFQLTNRMLGADDPEYQGSPDGSEGAPSAQIEMFQYFTRLVAERRRERRDDLLSVLVESEIDGSRLTDEEILLFALLLIVAGNETTRNAISGGMLALIENPEERARLMADRSLLPTAVEEIVRWTSPVLHMMRTAAKDVEIRGQKIAEGERLALWYPSANRDEEVFPDPYRFDVGREPNEHLGFGIGEHFCLGAGLARLEIRVMFEELLDRLPDIEPAGPVERLRSTFIGGIKHLPVRYTPAKQSATNA